MLSTLFTILAAAINLYTILCVISIILTWFPGAKFTKFGKFLSSLCDPYLNIFSKNGRMCFGNIDFSPILAIGILSLGTSILSKISTTGRIYLGGILGELISMLWSIASSLLGIFILLILIRWIILLFQKGQINYNSGWYQVDSMLQKPVEKISSTFSKKNLSYKKQLLISWISLCCISLLGSLLIGILVRLCNLLPF